VPDSDRSTHYAHAFAVSLAFIFNVWDSAEEQQSCHWIHRNTTPDLYAPHARTIRFASLVSLSYLFKMSFFCQPCNALLLTLFRSFDLSIFR
jgi:hypothetical protein